MITFIHESVVIWFFCLEGLKITLGIILVQCPPLFNFSWSEKSDDRWILEYSVQNFVHIENKLPLNLWNWTKLSGLFQKIEDS